MFKNDLILWWQIIKIICWKMITHKLSYLMIKILCWKMIAPAGNHLHVVLPTELHLRELIQSGFDYNLSSVVQLVITQCKVIMKKLQGIATSFHREKTGICLQTAQLSLVIGFRAFQIISHIILYSQSFAFSCNSYKN